MRRSGALVSVFYVASGVCQFAAGFAVDRFGARPVLLGGHRASGRRHAARAPSFRASTGCFPLVALMGVGNGVFHPADFAVLNANVDPRRLGLCVQHARHRRQPRLCARADRELRHRQRLRLARRAAAWRCGAARRSSRWRAGTQRACSYRSRAHDAAHATRSRSSIALFLQRADPALLRLLLRADAGGDRASRPSAGTALNAAYGVPLGVATSALDRLSARQHAPAFSPADFSRRGRASRSRRRRPASPPAPR